MLFASRWDHANRPSRREEAHGGRTATVLLVAGAQARTTYRGILAQRGYDMIDADSPSNAIELARTVRPSLIMAELDLPHGDGWETLRLLKSSPETCLIPVVATSLAAPPGGTYHRARSAGFVDLVTRPIERRHLLEIVATWVRPPAAPSV